MATRDTGGWQRHGSFNLWWRRVPGKTSYEITDGTNTWPVKDLVTLSAKLNGIRHVDTTTTGQRPQQGNWPRNQLVTGASGGVAEQQVRSVQAYRKVRCLCMSWELSTEDDRFDSVLPKSRGESKALTKLFRKPKFGYEAEYWKIPAEDTRQALDQKLKEWVEPSEKRPDHLLIICYSGHGGASIDEADPLSWYKYDDPDGPKVEWNTLQRRHLGPIMADTLLLLDCCHADAAVRGHQPGRKELFAAAAADGDPEDYEARNRPSFTDFLLEELKECRLPIATNQLMSQLVSKHHECAAGPKLNPAPLHRILALGGRPAQNYIVLDRVAPRGKAPGRSLDISATEICDITPRYTVGTWLPRPVNGNMTVSYVTERQLIGTAWVYRLSAQNADEPGRWFPESSLDRLWAARQALEARRAAVDENAGSSSSDGESSGAEHSGDADSD